ncbi:MAG TPA: tetratricopeptide repeat protein, partial [Ktedonobacteraceae bacterium]
VDWEDAPFARLHPLPSDATFLTEWTNIDRAFAEITAGLRRMLADLFLLTLRLPQNTSTLIWHLPFARNPFFLGQEELLNRLHTWFQAKLANGSHAAQALTGLSGIGKTQLAIEYAYRFRQHYQAVFWVSAENAETLYASYAEIARVLDLPQQKDPRQEIVVRAVKTWLQNHEHWLLILDNANEPDLCLPFLPSLLLGHILLTTQATALRRLGIAHILTLEGLTPAQATLLLLRRAGRLLPDDPLENAPAEEQHLALQLAQELGVLPLALDQAGAYLEATGMNLDVYIQIYHQYQLDLLAEHRGQEQYHPAPVATTWQLAFQRVEARNPAAVALLQVCAFLHPDAIDEALLMQGGEMLGPLLSPVVSNRFLFEKAIEALRAYSLITRDAFHQTLGIHRLVQSVVRTSLHMEEQQNWVQRVTLLLARAFPVIIEVSNWDRCERLLPHVLLAAQWSRHDTVQATADLAYLLNQAGYFLLRRARFEEAQPLLRQSLALYERVLGTEQKETAQTIHNLAELTAAQGDYEQAETLYARALAIRERVLGKAHLETIQTMMTLGRLYREQGNYERARQLLEHVLALREQILGPEHPETARSLGHLAFLARKQGQYQEAETLLLRAMAIWQHIRGPEYPDHVQTLHTLAGLYREQGRYVEAEPLIQQANQLWEQTLGGEHPHTLRGLNNLAGLYREQGQFEKAQPLYERVLAVRERVLGNTHPDTAQSLNNLAGMYRAQGKYEQARQLYERALLIREQFLGPEHPLTAQTVHNLARLAHDQGRLENAEMLYKRALAMSQVAQGNEHPDTLRSMSDLGSFYTEQGQYEQAANLLEQTLSIQKRLLGHEHPDTLRTLSQLGRLYIEQGQYEQAESVLQQGIKAQERILGLDHPALIYSLNALAMLYHRQHRENEKSSIYKRILALQERVLGPEHMDTQITRDRLAAMISSQPSTEEQDNETDIMT